MLPGCALKYIPVKIWSASGCCCEVVDSLGLVRGLRSLGCGVVHEGTTSLIHAEGLLATKTNKQNKFGSAGSLVLLLVKIR